MVVPSGTQNPGNAAATVLTFNFEQVDSDGFHDTVTNPGRLTIPTGLGGYYRVWASVGWATNATGYRRLWVRKNGATALFGTTEQHGTPGVFVEHCEEVVALIAGDYIEALVEQNSGGALATDNDGGAVGAQTFFGCQLIGT